MPVRLPVHYKQPNSSECRPGLPDHEAERTEQSLRAEAAYQDWSEVPDAERPLAATRGAHASALFAVLKAHRLSIVGFADKIGVNERQARKYLEARAPIPSTIFDALPAALADDLLARIRALRGGPKTASDQFRAALSAVERDGASAELLAEGHRRLAMIIPRGGR